MKKVFRDYDQVALDAQYEQRAWVPHADDIIRGFGVASDEVRARLGEPGTYAYGPSAAEALDVYGFSTRKALVFVHGGAWKRQSKRENAFAAETFLHAGAAYVVLDFALLPTVTLPEMAAQVCRAIEWVASNLSENVFLCGHSSGAHLAACALTRVPSVKAALLVSGIYDLLPVRLSARNNYVRLDERLEHEYSPLRHLERIGCPVSVAWAEKESAEFARQSREFASALQKTGKLSVALEAKKLNHFEVIETLADPRSPLARAALKMIDNESR